MTTQGECGAIGCFGPHSPIAKIMKETVATLISADILFSGGNASMLIVRKCILYLPGIRPGKPSHYSLEIKQSQCPIP
jgi:hypothetical protein